MGAAVYFIVGIFLVAVGVMCEHYMGPKPKLSNDDLFTAFDLIDVFCDHDYTKVREMRESLWSWMDSPGMPDEHLSKDLQEIVKRAKLVGE